MYKDKKVSPGRLRCLWCNRPNVSEPNSMAILTGGALLLNKKRDTSLQSDLLDGYLYLTWHGLHSDKQPEGNYEYENLAIAKGVRGGQFELYFCSTKCVRSFFDHVVDSLEAKIKKSKRTKKK